MYIPKIIITHFWLNVYVPHHYSIGGGAGWITHNMRCTHSYWYHKLMITINLKNGKLLSFLKKGRFWQVPRYSCTIQSTPHLPSQSVKSG